jgi:hypothetical protein
MTSDQLALQTIPGNITCHGLVSIQRVKELLSRVDVSISALALHRKPCFENSLLKVRESLGYGIPTILACYDSDVSNKGFDFIYEIPNTRENVDENWQGMRKFIFDMIDRRADREALYPLINQRQKEEKRLAFMQSILQTI